MRILLFIALLFAGGQAGASDAEIQADYRGLRVRIALDSNGVPRLNGNAMTSPTIKDFRKDSGFSRACYSGPQVSAEQLMRELVDATNGGGDSWFSSKWIYGTSSGRLTVVVTITDESSIRQEIYRFGLCK